MINQAEFEVSFWFGLEIALKVSLEAVPVLVTMVALSKMSYCYRMYFLFVGNVAVRLSISYKRNHFQLHHL